MTDYKPPARPPRPKIPGEVGYVAGTIQPGGRRARVTSGPFGVRLTIGLTPDEQARLSAAETDPPAEE